jgi:DNA (cytosine-5)-methyltransferase 1
MNTVHVADHFAGAGGTSTGAVLALKEMGYDTDHIDLLAINHWEEAISTHEKNHPWARHSHEDVLAVNPLEAFPNGHLDLLITTPECRFHSMAAGGRPINDQSRASAWHSFRWLELLRVDNFLFENVPDFMQYGPVHAVNRRPIKSLKGVLFRQYLHVLRAFGYNVDYRVLNAADFGAPTSRRRLFIIARLGDRPIVWPEPTHSKHGRDGLKKWKPARSVIDWSIEGQSIFARKRPLKPRTMARIVEGVRRFGGPEFRPFLVLMEQSGRGGPMVRDVEDPIPTITTARGGSIGLVDGAFILSQGSGGAPRLVDDPMATIPGKGAHALVSFFGERDGQRPRTQSVDDPLPAVTSHGAGGVAEAFILPPEGYFQGGRTHNPAKPLDAPIGSLTQRGGGHIVNAFLLKYNRTGGARSLDAPLDTATTKDRNGVVEARIIGAQSIEDPVPTLTARQRIALVQPEIDGWRLDIKFRMLQPHELAAAMTFPKGYEFVGTKEETIRQIGNAVVVDMAKALVKSILTAPDHGRLRER